MIRQTERRSCAGTHEKMDRCFEEVAGILKWINGNGVPGAKSTIASILTTQKIQTGLLISILLLIVGLFVKGGN